MADSLTPNLKLRVSDDLTADARYNLNRIDGLGGATKVENNGNLRIRSVRDIIFTPESQDLGGNGTGGTVSVGESGVEIDTFEIFANLVDFNDSPALIRELRFPELSLNGVNYVGFAPPDLIPSNVIWKLPSADGLTSQVLITDGAGNLGWATVLTDSLNENNVNVGDSSNVSAPVDTSVVGDILADSATGLTIKANVITDAEISNVANIDVTKLEALDPNIVVITDPSGFIGSSAVTSTELSYLSGADSNVQDQIDDEITARAAADVALQSNIDGKQPLDADLTALAALASTGLVARTGAGTVSARTLQAGAGINIIDGDGVSADPTISSTISQYTDEEARDAVGTILASTNSVDLSYNDGTPSISADLNLSAAAADAGFVLVSTDIQPDGLRAQFDGAEITNRIYDNGFAATWAPGDGITKVVTHNLGGVDVLVQVYDTLDNQTIYVDTVIRTDDNTVTLTSTQTPLNNWRVLIFRMA